MLSIEILSYEDEALDFTQESRSWWSTTLCFFHLASLNEW